MIVHTPTEQSECVRPQNAGAAPNGIDRPNRDAATVVGHRFGISKLSDETDARIYGMVRDVARQIAIAELAAEGHRGIAKADQDRTEKLASDLFRVPEFIEFCFGQACEWRLSEDRTRPHGEDGINSPLLQALIASENARVAQTAMMTLAAQARFVRAKGRMALPVAELPAQLFVQVLECWKASSHPRRSDSAVRTEAKLRNAFDEGRRRLTLLSRLVAGLRDTAITLPRFDQMGIALFFSALATRTGYPRTELLVFANGYRTRQFCLALRAAGLDRNQILDTFEHLALATYGLADAMEIGSEEARSLLAAPVSPASAAQ